MRLAGRDSSAHLRRLLLRRERLYRLSRLREVRVPRLVRVQLEVGHVGHDLAAVVALVRLSQSALDGSGPAIDHLHRPTRLLVVLVRRDPVNRALQRAPAVLDALLSGRFVEPHLVNELRSDGGGGAHVHRGGGGGGGLGGHGVQALLTSLLGTQRRPAHGVRLPPEAGLDLGQHGLNLGDVAALDASGFFAGGEEHEGGEGGDVVGAGDVACGRLWVRGW